MGALLGVISDIHGVQTNLEDPVDVRNVPQQGNCPQVVSSSNFLRGLELSLSSSFFDGKLSWLDGNFY